jgi:CRP/FNR family cyclic AMP-dependent transcriptional regulator
MKVDSDIIEKMSANRWFASLPAEEQRSLIASSTELRIDVGNLLFRSGDAADGFYGVVEGRMKASTLRSDGKEAILVILEAGNWFGQLSLVGGMPRVHDITAIEPTRVLRVSNEAFDAQMQHAAFARAIAELESQHTFLLYQMMQDATLHSTRTRIARRLMRLARGDATMAAEHRAAITVSQDTLAMMLGITRQTLALELKAMAAEGAVALRYGRVEIVSIDVLNSIAE